MLSCLHFVSLFEWTNKGTSWPVPLCWRISRNYERIFKGITDTTLTNVYTSKLRLRHVLIQFFTPFLQNRFAKTAKITECVRLHYSEFVGLTNWRQVSSAHSSLLAPSSDTHVVISHVLFTFRARLKVCLTIIFLVFGGVQKWHQVQSTQTRMFFLMTLYF